MKFLQLIRFPNLLIVALTQGLIYFRVITPLYGDSFQAILSPFYFALLVLTTILIAAGGYIINDIMDYEIDLINKPHKVVVGKHLSLQNARYSYWGTVLLGLGLSIFIGYKTSHLSLLYLYPLAVGLLYAYSAQLKAMPLVGNLVVALFCAFVPGVVLLAEWETIILLRANHIDIFIKISALGIWYIGFAFLTTLLREIIKDIEDIRGDKAKDCQTLPIVWGIKKAKYFTFFLALLTHFSIHAIFAFEGDSVLFFRHIPNLLLFLPSIYILVQLYLAKKREDYAHLSFVIKLLMIAGLIYLMLI